MDAIFKELKTWVNQETLSSLPVMKLHQSKHLKHAQEEKD